MGGVVDMFRPRSPTVHVVPLPSTAVSPTSDQRALLALEHELTVLRGALLQAEADHAPAIAATHPSHRDSATNLVHYVELRRHDIRDLQERLVRVGLSSLGRSEAHVLATIDAVLVVIERLLGHQPQTHRVAPVSMEDGPRLLTANTERLLGPSPSARTTRIMVTMPTEAADSPALVTAMTAGGMDVARVNCAHDDDAVWERMIVHVRSNVKRSGRRPLVSMDLGGPKVRTGPLEPGPRVVKVRPTRDLLGVVVDPAAVRLSLPGATPGDHPGVVHIPVDDAGWLRRRVAGDGISLRDGRGSLRRWVVAQVDEHGCLATAGQTTYVTTGTELVAETREGDPDVTTVGELPAVELAHRVTLGDRIVLTRSLDPAPARPAGSVHRIGCTLPELLAGVRHGDRVWLDDGKIGGLVDRVRDGAVELVVTDVRPGGTKLRAGKGINVPESNVTIAALTEQDLRDLDVAAARADIVSMSFVRTVADVVQLQDALHERGADDLGIVLKIENAPAFEHLPELLLAALRSRKVGVMIARGDLAVEVGFERLAEVQEEIMWLCEAAHVPVIWATQVLDTLARTGQPSRAEVTDAAMGVRAECVMLNKGPHIVEAIEVLDSILIRMQHHQRKKRSLLRRLTAWDRADEDALSG